MAYLSQRELRYITEPEEEEVLIDPIILQAAQRIYYTYCKLHVQLKRTPIGVAIDPKTNKGQLLFTKRPILLPGEFFVPLNQLEANIHWHQE